MMDGIALVENRQVPKGRLILAQDAVLGRIEKLMQSRRGRLKTTNNILNACTGYLYSYSNPPTQPSDTFKLW
jgi:hypothetical protein